jgi:hypothetical protein
MDHDLPLLSSVQSFGSMSLAPSDASNQIAFEELSAISKLMDSKSKELSFRENTLFTLRNKLNSEINHAQNMLETFADTLIDEGHHKLTTTADSLVRRVSAALEAADLRLVQHRQAKEHAAALEAKAAALEEQVQDLKLKLSCAKKQVNALTKQKIPPTVAHAAAQTDRVSVLAKSPEMCSEASVPPAPPQLVVTTAAVATQTAQEGVSVLDVLGKLPDYADPDFAVTFATRLLLEGKDINSGCSFIIGALFNRLMLAVFAGSVEFETPVTKENVLTRARMEILKKRLGVSSVEKGHDIPDCTIAPVAIQGNLPASDSARFQLFSCLTYQQNIVEKLQELRTKSSKLSVLLFALSRVSLDVSALEDPECIKCVCLIEVDELKNFNAKVREAVRTSDFLVHKLFEQALNGKEVAALLLGEVATVKHKMWLDKLVVLIDQLEKAGKKPHANLFKKIVRNIKN